MRCDFQVKIEGGDHCQAGSEEIGHVKRGKLGDIAAQNQPDSDAYIPRGEIGGSGSAALAVRSQVDKQRVEGWKHGAKPDSQQQCYHEEKHIG